MWQPRTTTGTLDDMWHRSWGQVKVTCMSSIPTSSAPPEGHVEVALTLIEHGADVTAQNKVMDTPLHLASRWGDVEVYCMLIEHGAAVTARSEHGDLVA
jgi:ankyrin repeat protein